jgi:TRAP-type C4-dicarboxylate transport system permease small subunit
MWDSCLENGVATLACVPIIIKNIINAALAFAGIAALILIIYASFQYTTSKGDQAKIDSAKKTLTYAIIGLIVIFLSFFIVSLISQLTGVKQIANPSI